MKRLQVHIKALAVLTLLLTGGCADLRIAADDAPPAVAPLYLPSGVPPTMPTPDFLGYIEATRDQLVRANRAAGTPLTLDDAIAAGPFELRPRPPGQDCRAGAKAPYDKGILMVHGLNDTPSSMWDLASRFARACYMVRVILLPGHGTVPGDLLTVGLGDWIKAVHQGIASFSGEVDRLVLLGADLGANLALDAALAGAVPQDLDLDGLVLIAPAFAYRTTRFSPDLVPAAFSPGGEALWGDILREEDELRYASIARQAVQEVNDIGDDLAAQPSPLHIPLFVVASAQDAVVDPRLIGDWFCAEPLMPRRLWWYGRYPTFAPRCRCFMPRRNPSKEKAEACVIFRSGAHGKKIVDLSHQALLAAPDNPRYGAHSRYFQCLHYDRNYDRQEWLTCIGVREADPARPLRYGEASDENLRHYTLRRQSYNPDFAKMADAILAFLERHD